MVYAGSFVGFFIFPHIADNYGRKIAIFGAWISATIGVLLAAISFDVIMTGFGWFFIGFGANPAITLSYSFINEQSLGKYRQYFSVGIQMALALG
jgi:OCT family organic cation transporter-like MFS transporter 4/5